MEKEYYTAREVCNLLNISSATLYRWRQDNKFDYKRISYRKYLYYKKSVDEFMGICEDTKPKKNVIYCRVSTSNQKDDLLKQKQLLQDYCTVNGYIVDEVFMETASGMNDNRKEFNRLIDQVLEYEISTIFITFKDRLTRFGFDHYKRLFEKFGCKIIIVNNPVNESNIDKEITDDLISIIHHFSMKMYSNRRKQLKEMAKTLQTE